MKRNKDFQKFFLGFVRIFCRFFKKEFCFQATHLIIFLSYLDFFCLFSVSFIWFMRLGVYLTLKTMQKMVSFDIMYYNTIAYSSRGGVMTHSQKIQDLLSFNCFQLLNENIPFETYENFLLNLQIYVPVCLFLFSKTTIINNLVHKCSI